MSNNLGVEPKSPSRRSVVKGAAWAVPAVVVAGAAPAMAASPGPLTFTGGACKLPGSSSDTFKGYVFELTAFNETGPIPVTGITVISSVVVNGVNVGEAYGAFVRSGPTCSGACASTTCGGEPAAHQFCTPDGGTQQILIYTGPEPTGSSSNAEMVIQFQRFECTGCVAIDPSPVTLSSGLHATPPATPGGGSCNVQNVFPLPS